MINLLLLTMVNWQLKQAQLSQRDYAMCYVSWNLVKLLHSCTKNHTRKGWGCHTTSSEIPLPDRPYITSYF